MISWLKRVFAPKASVLPGLSKAEIKTLLKSALIDNLSDFTFLEGDKNGFHLQKKRKLGHYIVYETFHIYWSFKYQYFRGFVCSVLNPELVFSKPRRTGILNVNKDIASLMKNKMYVTLDDSKYSFEKSDSILNALDQIAKDCWNLRSSFLERRSDYIRNSEMVSFGLDYIANLNYDKEKLKIELRKEHASAQGIHSRIKLPVYINLKEALQNIKGQSLIDRRSIPELAFELLEVHVYSNHN